MAGLVPSGVVETGENIQRCERLHTHVALDLYTVMEKFKRPQIRFYSAFLHILGQLQSSVLTEP